MSIGRIAVTILSGGAFLFFTIINYIIIYRARIKHEYTPSLTPFLGGISGVLLVLTTIGTKYPLLLILPLLVDFGSIPLVIEFIVLFIRRGKSETMSVYSTLKKKLSEEDYGGIYVDHDSVVVMSVNEEKIKKITDEVKKDSPEIILKPCKYSVKELESAYNYLVKNMKKYEIIGLSIDVMNNRINVQMEKCSESFEKYMDTLENSDIIYVEYNNVK